MYDIHRLRVLRELKLRGTLTAVASALSYSPSTISQQLGQLEAEVGVRLIEPVGRKVRLTAGGGDPRCAHRAPDGTAGTGGIGHRCGQD